MTSVAMAALVADGLLAGLSLDKVIVQLPARQRIGVRAYADYATLSLLHSAATARAAPAMFQVGRAGDTEAALSPLLTRFARWSAARAALQTATLILVALAIAAGT